MTVRDIISIQRDHTGAPCVLTTTTTITTLLYYIYMLLLYSNYICCIFAFSTK